MFAKAGAALGSAGGLVVSGGLDLTTGGLAIPLNPEIVVGGAALGGAVGYGVGNLIDGLVYATPPDNAYDPNGPKAPGKPGAEDGFIGPKDGDNWVPNPNGRGSGWQDSSGNVWVPTGQGGAAHGGPHWDVQRPDGNYENVRPVKK